jgi:YegS/Rv2252/BmrU family lipid kinase
LTDLKRVYFIFNLHSGKASLNNFLPKMLDQLTAADCEVTVHPTQCQGDGITSAQYACEQQFDFIICAGGDGTLNEVIQGCMASEHHLPVGYVPSGSTNDFARGLQIPTAPLDAISCILNGHTIHCDVGKFNTHYFTYIAAFGAFTEISYQTPQSYKNVLGHAAYVLNGIAHLPNIKARHMKIEYDDGKTVEGEYLYGMVTNATSVAKLLSLSDVEWDDGLFEVTLIRKPTDLVQFHQLILSLANFQLGAERQYFDYFRASHIVVTNLDEEEVAWTIDGEYGGSQRVNEIDNCQKALQIFVPEP